VDGDGILEIVQSPPGGPTETTEVYKFDGQKFTLATSQVYFETFYRRTAAPVTETRTFQVQNPGAGFVLTVVNGATDGSNKVSSGTVKLNGAVVLSPNDLNQQVRKVVRQVTVLPENVLEVELAAKPVSGLSLGAGAVRRSILGSTYTWTIVFFLYMWLGALAVGGPGVASLVGSVVAAGAIFLFIRARGGDYSS